ncbi:hypothetical protein JMJ35_000083 [Cladonia borealis]|uniref:Protein kinase domain-containing protein n=1 Tax=Cladonia borealis TaxID=184061 RepID=A0AA39V5A7_9LECA|nr:hypothetical protein JMJ35_000083 [Cladonia borealis]
MMDGLSVVTGVITLVTVVVEVVKKARTFYQASEEFEELLEQIEQFTNALAGIDDQERTYPSNIKIVDPPNFFCSSLNGLLVYEVKFKDSIPAVGLLYTIRVLHCMNGSPGFTKLIGIVTDNSRRYLKSYLIELPKACRNILQIAADPSVPWERRERWAAQLVQGISRLHAHSFLVGGLCTCNIPLIDDTASVQFWSFRERFLTGRKTGAYYPPECLYIRDMPPTIEEADSPKLTSKTDIFHLGLMLWLLAENKPRTHASPTRNPPTTTTNKDMGSPTSSHSRTTSPTLKALRTASACLR